MEIKCSLKNHLEIKAISYCQECKRYMCNKCDKLHSELFNDDHHQYKLDKDTTEIFTGLCKEKNHLIELTYFCITHNKLCCPKCITKIKNEEDGQHTDCNVCSLKDIEDEKRNKLKIIIKDLENLSNNLEQSIAGLKKILEENNQKREELKINIQKIFTKLRNALNDREDQLLLEVDKQFNNKFYFEDIIKKADKLPNQVKASLEKGKLIDEQWKNKNNKINILINDCLNIENNIKEIKDINDKKEKLNELKVDFEFLPDSKGINELLNEINKFGSINQNIRNMNIFDSKIEFEQSLVFSWLGNKKFISELLFRKSRDGSTCNDFHNKCDNKGNTIIFIETAKGYKFGGYTELQWERSSSYKYKKDNKSTFIFSLNHKEKYTNRIDNNSICCYSDKCPWFGSKYPEIFFENSLNKGESWDNTSENTFLLGRKLTNGEQYWEVKELEAYKIIYV